MTQRRLGLALRLATLALVYWVTASAVLGSFVDHWALGDKWRRSRFNRAVHFTAPPPFVYRVLVPGLVVSISNALPEKARSSLAAKTADLRQHYALREGNEVEYAVAYYLLFACYLGTLFVWRATFRHFGRGSPLFCDFAPAVALLLLPMTFLQGGFIYDPSELLLTSLALQFFLGRRWIPYYLTFFVAVVNKESNILLPVWLLAPFTLDRDWRFLLRHGALSVAVGSPPFLAIRWWFRDQRGDPFIPLWWDNLRYLAQPETYWSGFDVYAPHVPAPEGFHPFNLFLLAGTLVYVWRRDYLRELRWIFLYSVAAFTPFFLIFGYRDEIRVFGPSYAAFLLLAAHGLRESVAGKEEGGAGEPGSRHEDGGNEPAATSGQP